MNLDWNEAEQHLKDCEAAYTAIGKDGRGRIYKVKIKISIPTHVRQFCEGEFKMYPYYKARIRDRREEIIQEGGDLTFHKMSPKGGGISLSPEIIKIERIMTDKQIQTDEYACACIEDVIRGSSPRQIEVIEACYWQGLTNLQAAEKLNLSERMVKRYKHDAILRLAIRRRLI